MTRTRAHCVGYGFDQDRDTPLARSVNLPVGDLAKAVEVSPTLWLGDIEPMSWSSSLSTISCKLGDVSASGVYPLPVRGEGILSYLPTGDGGPVSTSASIESDSCSWYGVNPLQCDGFVFGDARAVVGSDYSRGDENTSALVVESVDDRQ